MKLSPRKTRKVIAFLKRAAQLCSKDGYIPGLVLAVNQDPDSSRPFAVFMMPRMDNVVTKTLRSVAEAIDAGDFQQMIGPHNDDDYIDLPMEGPGHDD